MEGLEQDFARLGLDGAGKKRRRRAKLRLSPHEEKRVETALQGDPNEVLVTKCNIDITRKDLRLLLPGEWLNDEIINFYMSLLQEYSNQRCSEWEASYSHSAPSSTETPPSALLTSPGTAAQGVGAKESTTPTTDSEANSTTEARTEDEEEAVSEIDTSGEIGNAKVVDEGRAESSPSLSSSPRQRRLRCHFFNTFFYPLLNRGGYQRVARWTRRVDLMSMDLIVFPIHKSLHWTLATASPQDHTLAYYDSLQISDAQCLGRLRSYLEEEEKKNQQGGHSQPAAWRIAGLRPQDVPRQMNGSDCGVFACMFARSLTRGAPLSDIHQRDMPYYRKLIALEILNVTILDNR